MKQTSNQKQDCTGLPSVIKSPSHHSWKFAACVESQKSMPITAVAVSPAGSSSVEMEEGKSLQSFHTKTGTSLKSHMKNRDKD